uniref:Uncharacterized protein n=1 Tax=Panagrolaimus sp. PS1159 TaxID=55785 RepID=A0AC35G0H6_9BILA
MTTKNEFLFLRDKYQAFAKNNLHNDNKNQYYNLNLNQNNTSPILIPVKSCSKTYSERICDSALPNNYEAKGRIKSSDKSSNLCLTSLKLNDETQVEKHWKKNRSSNNSTLSLHISPYENSNKASSDSFDEMSNDGLKKEKSGTISKCEITKQILIVSTFVNENPFEFPRQQNDRITKPEVSQFKTFQRLLNPNKASSNLYKN